MAEAGGHPFPVAWRAPNGLCVPWFALCPRPPAQGSAPSDSLTRLDLSTCQEELQRPSLDS